MINRFASGDPVIICGRRGTIGQLAPSHGRYGAYYTVRMDTGDILTVSERSISKVTDRHRPNVEHRG